MREKIQNLLWRFDICRAEESETIDKIEELADEFAIGFANWYEFMLRQSDNLNSRFTPKELIEMFKKEKGL
jgi:hypothetical protein